MMSAPTAACTVTGTSRSRAATSRDASGAARPARRARGGPGGRGGRAAGPKGGEPGGRGRAEGRGAGGRFCWGAARWERSCGAKGPPRGRRSWVVGRGGGGGGGGGGGVLLEL